MNSFPPEFVAENELERAYAQSQRWASFRVWRRACSSLAAGRYGVGAGFLMRLAGSCALLDDSDRLFELMMSICDHEHLLEPIEKKSICRICHGVVDALRLIGKDSDDACVAIILTAMLKLTGSLKTRDFVFVEMLGYLRRLNVESLRPEDIQKAIEGLSYALPNYVKSFTISPGFSQVSKIKEISPPEPRRHYRIIPALVRQNRFENPSKFVAMLAAASLEKCRKNTQPEDLPELKELTRFYDECSHETARCVGEMLWLLIETELRHASAFVTRLPVLGLMKASDDNAIDRFLFYTERLSSLDASSDKVRELQTIVHTLLRRLKGEQYDKDVSRVLPGAEEQMIPTDMQQIDAQIAAGNWQVAFDLTAQALGVDDVSREDTFRLLIRSARIRIGQSDMIGGTVIMYKLFFGLKKLL